MLVVVLGIMVVVLTLSNQFIDQRESSFFGLFGTISPSPITTLIE